jgi:hypothetical protein
MEVDMSALPSIPKSYDQIRDESMGQAWLAGLVARTLEKAARGYPACSDEYNSLLAAAVRYHQRELEHLEYAGHVQLAILCIEAGFEPLISSVCEIEMAHKRWRAHVAAAA